jgi:hypothetical protein
MQINLEAFMIKYIVLLIGSIIQISSVFAQDIKIIEYSKATRPVREMNTPIQRDYLKLDYLPLSTQLNPFLRDLNVNYPGDYFWPPDGLIQKKDGKSSLNTELTKSEVEEVLNFLKDNFPTKFPTSKAIESLRGYAYSLRTSPSRYSGEPRREAYTMLSDADTIYVVSGWLGKFLSFYRVVPGDFRLSILELMNQLDKLTPLAGEIDEKGFKHESDSLNYLWEYVDRDKMFRIRNYLMKATLPPNPPDSPEKYYNLVEITKFYDKGVIP